MNRRSFFKLAGGLAAGAVVAPLLPVKPVLVGTKRVLHRIDGWDVTTLGGLRKQNLQALADAMERTYWGPVV